MFNRTATIGRRTAAVALLLVVTTGASGCSSLDSLLEVKLPGAVSEEGLNNPGMATILVNGAIGDFECAFATYIGRTGLLTDEFITSAGWRAINVVDARLSELARAGGGTCATALNSDGTDVYGPLHRARFQAEDSYKRITDFPADQVPTKELLLATAAAYAGYSLALLGEGFCENAVDGGPRLSPEDMWRLAEARFTAAIQHATTANNQDILNMARVGRGRMRLNLGKKEEAATDAALVPEGYVKNATYSATVARRQNRVFALNRANNFISPHPSFRNLMVGSVPDTRVALQNANRKGHDGVTDMYYSQRYTTVSSPIPIASWREAQLIVAEGRGGQLAVQAINRLRQTATLPLFSSTSDAQIFQQVLEERRRELYAQGHRINELLRHKIPWESGTTHKGEPYGTVTCMPLVDGEILNNPNFPR